MLKTTKRFVLIATTAVVLTSSAGCNLSSFRQVTNNLIGSSFSQGKKLKVQLKNFPTYIVLKN